MKATSRCGALEVSPWTAGTQFLSQWVDAKSWWHVRSIDFTLKLLHRLCRNFLLLLLFGQQTVVCVWMQISAPLKTIMSKMVSFDQNDEKWCFFYKTFVLTESSQSSLLCAVVMN